MEPLLVGPKVRPPFAAFWVLPPRGARPQSRPRTKDGTQVGPEAEAVGAANGLIEAARTLARGPALAGGTQAFGLYLGQLGAVMDQTYGVAFPSTLTPVASQAARLGLEPELCAAFVGGWFDLDRLP